MAHNLGTYPAELTLDVKASRGSSPMEWLQRRPGVALLELQYR